MAVERTAAYLNWRYSRHPKLKYRIFTAENQGDIVGYAVTRTEVTSENNTEFKIGRIIDLVAFEYSEECIIRMISNLYSDAVFIDFFLTGEHYSKSLDNAGFLNTKSHNMDSLPYRFQPLERRSRGINFLIYIDEEMMDMKDEISDINNWYITRGEGDQDRPT